MTTEELEEMRTKLKEIFGYTSTVALSKTDFVSAVEVELRIEAARASAEIAEAIVEISEYLRE